MIKRFKLKDLGYFIPNEYSNPDVCLDQLCDPEYNTFTLWDNGMVAAIICFKSYWEDNYQAFFLISYDFKPRLAHDLKVFVHTAAAMVGAKRIQTHSVDSETLELWHKHLGFECEGTHKKMLYGKDYKTWALVLEGE